MPVAERKTPRTTQRDYARKPGAVFNQNRRDQRAAFFQITTKGDAPHEDQFVERQRLWLKEKCALWLHHKVSRNALRSLLDQSYVGDDVEGYIANQRDRLPLWLKDYPAKAGLTDDDFLSWATSVMFFDQKAIQGPMNDVDSVRASFVHQMTKLALMLDRRCAENVP